MQLRTTFLTLLSVFTLSTMATEAEVVAIGIGDKNATLDESKFPNMDIYYTPSISVTGNSAHKSYAGEPAFLAEWMNGIGEPNDFLILGSNGVVYDQGTAILDEAYVTEADTERRGNILKAVERVTEDDKTFRESRGDVDVEDEKGFVRHTIPLFTMMTPSGNSVNSDAVFENGKAKLVIFFYLDADTYIGGEDDSRAEVRGREYMRGRRESSSGVKGVQSLIQIERELFGNIVHEIY